MIEFVLTVVKFAFAAAVYYVRGKLLQLWPPAERPVVLVRQGKLRGITAVLPNGTRYHYFKGIPYAKPPVGELRFKPPIPLEKFDKPLMDCILEQSDCVQEDLFTHQVVGSEMGLYINIFTPYFVDTDQPKYPVMVFIHGGGFLAGSGSSIFYNPIHLVQEGVIVVTMNYRLGPLGFLSFPSAGIVGNAGLKDQLLVFRWIRENISQFCGDPDNVTVFGESAGSISTYLHYLSPNSRKYFNRVICQSGIPCTETFFQANGNEKARELAKILGYKGNCDKEALKTLMEAPASALIKHQHKVLTTEEKRAGVKFAFMPVIEESASDDSIITETPEAIIKSSNNLDMPIIDGCNSGEGILTLFLMKNRYDVINSEPERFVPQLLGTSTSLNRVELGKEIRKFYFDDKEVDRSTADELSDVMADNYFITNSVINAEWMAKYQPNIRHYHYRFTYHGQFSITKKLFNQSQAKGACHGDDVFYIFSPPYLPKLPESSTECQVRNTFAKLWTNFAKYGEPTLDEAIGYNWLPVAKIDASDDFKLDCLQIDTNTKMILNPYPERIKLWRRLLNQYRKGFL
ncbi:acetylcholinesterase-like [Toxorhynchites rutilus septentrionalis]|uniref:acetylcholinesterase-like n=1 Tax=Toxorhynchites rutilus septentrionalis TaxID=329112 RepID=UPI002479D0DB|nr:acetylcholinesterase-like [Toxorhynchites rutilus septentrionalis]